MGTFVQRGLMDSLPSMMDQQKWTRSKLFSVTSLPPLRIGLRRHSALLLHNLRHFEQHQRSERRMS